MANVRYYVGIVAGIVQLIIGAVLFVNFIINPLYPLLLPGLDVGGVWWWVNILMLVGMIIALLSSFHRKRLMDSVKADGVTRGYLEANVLFWASVALAFWFLPTWFSALTDVDVNWWTETNTLAILVYFGSGLYLVRNARNNPYRS